MRSSNHIDAVIELALIRAADTRTVLSRLRAAQNELPVHEWLPDSVLVNFAHQLAASRYYSHDDATGKWVCP